ncbi:MAG: ATP-grasp domain-containing protein [Methylocystis sp.]|nr:ATP-grasp domain-containing protein [Methylocystis sp.]
MFQKMLIANRGEVACRVMATAQRLGVRTVAVYSEADANARHVDLADEAWPIGPAPARESYLVIDKIMGIARRSGAQAVHPGYGFLAENAEFAEACAAAGIAFIGPPPQAMRIMGSKAAAKALMQRAGVPVVPGHHGDAQDLAGLASAARDVGFPILVKASAGGGGKGMRIVERADDLPSACEAARREALAAFGDDRLLIEKYLTRPRHIEVQIFADAHGGLVSFPERDCSIQRRYQKILEETPAPRLEPALQRAISEAAIAAARIVAYVGAGTVEFLTQGESFYFLEMNTRLQVEHPITEMVARQDLVEWQLRVACGEKLPFGQEELNVRGHAIEARVYAEDPARGFAPSVGVLEHLREPREGANVRVDTGVRRGDLITHYYDPMIAKLIVWDEDRRGAVLRLAAALADYEVVGVATNLDLLRAVASHPDFIAGEIDTGFIDRHRDELIAATPLTETEEIASLAAGAAAWIADLRARQATEAANPFDPWSPWGMADAWRINGDGRQDIAFDLEGRRISLRISPRPDGSYRLDARTKSVLIAAAEDEDGMRLYVDGVLHRLRVVRQGDRLVVVLRGRNHVLNYVDPLAPPPVERAAVGELTAPLPARVTRVLVDTGDIVKKGTPLIVLEAMKMELTLAAPRDGAVVEIRYAAGDMAPEGAELIVLREGEAA